MVFGGFAQFFVTWLVHATGSPIAPVFYVMFGAAIALVSLMFVHYPAREPLVRFAVEPAMNSVLLAKQGAPD
jgi:MHS family proline/betaine transporter-like MFS transporter